LHFAACYFLFFRRNKNEILILLYHRLNDSVKKELSVKRENFIWQMNYLKRKRYRIISMDEAYHRMLNEQYDGRYLVLTFDDGYEDFYCNTFPILKENMFPALLYIVPGFIETGKTFYWDRDIGESRLMNWEQLLSLGRSGLIDFGSHTLNHIDLDKLDGMELRNELEYSKRMLEEKLNRDIIHFSYPRGIYSSEAEKVIKQYYQTGVLIYGGKDINKKFDTENLFKLKRVPIQNSDSKCIFLAKIKGWDYLEQIVRKAVKKV
jgi:peptidoglycan/xylan/chitin deacetylase (PgdA/CDA1 family)